MPSRLQNPLLQNLTQEEFALALRFFDAREIAYPRGVIIKSALDPITRFGLVLEGSVQVSMDDASGRQMVLNCVREGQTFGEALCYLQKDAPLTFLALTDIRILWLRCDRLHSPGDDFPAALREKLISRFTAMLAQRTLHMNDRIQILSKKTLRGKLVTFFSQQIKRRGSTAFEISMDRGAMADYLGTDRSALSRELSAMRDEGMLTFHKNHFELLRAHIFEE